MNKTEKVCPFCGNGLVEIIYGRPTPDVFLLVEQKKIFLGGCIVSEHNPKYHCYCCNKNFYENREEAR